MKRSYIAVAAFMVIACAHGPLTDRDACIAAHALVREQLKSPSTANFPDSFCTDLVMQKTAADDGDGLPTWLITGPVDAQNEFGAMLRHRYTVEVKDPGTNDGNYRGRVLRIWLPN